MPWADDRGVNPISQIYSFGPARRWLMPVGLAALLILAIAAARAPRASAAEAGVNLTNSNPVEISDVKTLGTHWVRMFATWPDLEPTKGSYDPFWFENIEKMISALPPGTKMILDVVNTPSWETGSSDEHTPPANPQEYAALLGMLAQRFAGRVAAYEIWNEENLASWWSGGPNPAAYAQLLEATYPAIKAADPSATVVLGGMGGNDYQFLEGVYAAGGKGSFDAVGVHTDTACNGLSPYEFLRGSNGRLVTDSFLAYREVHAVMLANGDDKPIWMTEMSWRTTEAQCSEGAWAGQKAEGVSEQQQSTFLKQAYNCLAQDSYVKVGLWFAGGSMRRRWPRPRNTRIFPVTNSLSSRMINFSEEKRKCRKSLIDLSPKEGISSCENCTIYGRRGVGKQR